MARSHARHENIPLPEKEQPWVRELCTCHAAKTWVDTPVGYGARRSTPPQAEAASVQPDSNTAGGRAQRDSSEPKEISIDAQTPDSRFGIWQDYPGRGAFCKFLESDKTIAVEDEDKKTFDVTLPADRTLVIRTPSEAWREAPFGVLSLVYWVSRKSSHPRYISHHQHIVPNGETATLYLELDADFDDFPLPQDAVVSIGWYVAYGLMHLLVMVS
jgi:hypothetical protein